MDPFLTCIPKLLAIEIAEQAAEYAMSQNADNAPHPSHVTAAIQAASAVGRNLEKPAIAALVKKMWPKDKGIELTVGFMDTPPAALITKIMSHMNAWGTRSNVHFSMTQNWQDARVRIARTDGADGGYWSYIGTDIDLADKGAPTMNLQGFTLAGTPDSEFYRVVRHESGHTLGFVHEHMRSGMVSRIDKQKAYVYYGYTQQ